MKSIVANVLVLMILPGLLDAAAIEKASDISPQWKFVTTVEGKTFYADLPYRNWWEASTRCKAAGLKLATITSRAQFDALEAAHDLVEFHYRFWTAGRDAQLLRQFSWDESNQQPPTNLTFRNFWPSLNEQSQTCLVFESLGIGRSFLYSYPCSRGNWVGTLCEAPYSTVY